MVTLAGALDAEIATQHSITVRATSADGSFSTRAFNIVVTDVDEFDLGPISDSDAAVDAVDENAAVGTVVGITASAFDADATNNTVTYSLTDDAGGLFAIDSVTGRGDRGRRASTRSWRAATPSAWRRPPATAASPRRILSSA